MAKPRRRTRDDRAKQTRTPAQRHGSRRRYGLAGGLVIFLAIAVAVAAWPRRGKWPPRFVSGSASGANVLLITLDTTRADRLGCYGYTGAATPTLDALATAGIRFDDAVTVAPITLPAHATIMTAVDPPHHGVRHNGEYQLDEKHETLAELLRTNGYETAAFVSSFVLDGRFGLDRGFDLYDDDVGVAPQAAASEFAKPIHERSAGAVTDRVIQWLKNRKDARPFFCWVHYFDPHSPYHPPAPLAARFAQEPYDGEIAYMDAQLGRLLQALDNSGAAKNTLTIAVADHGESLGDHGEATHGKLIYDSTMRVPLIISHPSLIRGPYVVDGVVVSVADILPTVVDLLGLADTSPRDGRSLLAGRATRDRMCYMETLAPYLDEGWSPLFGMRRHADKYVLAPKPEYFDLVADPEELENLYNTVVGDALVSRDLLVGELASRTADSCSLVAVVASAQEPDSEALRRLESLGYVGSVHRAAVDGGQLPDPKDMMPVVHAIDAADNLANAGRLQEALAMIEPVVASFPEDPKALLSLGKIYLHLNRLPEAERTFLRANEIRPSARLCILAAQIMLADMRLGEAAKLLDQAETLEPLHGGIFLARGDLFALQGRPDEAIAAYQHAREVDPYRAAAEAQSRIARLHEIVRIVKPP